MARLSHNICRNTNIKERRFVMLPVMFKRNWMPSVFDDLFGDDIVSACKPAVPAVNVMETDSEYVMEIAAPGLKKESSRITIENGVLSVSVKNEKN